LYYFFLDISVDTYVERQFESALIQEGKTLVNLINVNNGKISLSSHAELIDEYKEQSKERIFKFGQATK
jgi:hypothetical protein